MPRPQGNLLDCDGPDRKPFNKGPSRSCAVNASKGTTEIFIYGQIGEWGISGAQFAADLAAVKTPEVTVRVNSPGGDVFDGITIYNAIKRSGKKCTAVVDGLAASAASFIVQACDEVVMSEGSDMMIHDAHGIAVGSAEDLRATADLLDKKSADIANMYATRAGGTPVDWRNAMKETTWYSAQQAVDAGLADRIEGDSGASAKAAWGMSAPVFTEAPETPVVNRQVLPDLKSIHDALREAFD